MGNLLLGFVKGTEKALLENNVDFISQYMSEANLFNLGMMIALEERVVSFLASFWKINPYDQPGVQDGKKAANTHNELNSKVRKILQTAKHSF